MLRFNRVLLVVLLALTLMLGASAASAGPSFPQPTWCYRYTSFDGFNNPAAWSQWDNANTGTIFIGETTAAQTSPRAGSFLYTSGAEPGAFMLIERAFTPSQNLIETYRRGGCPVLSTPPSGPPLACKASIWIRPAWGMEGDIQLINAATYTYLAGTSFTVAPSQEWQEQYVYGEACSEDMVVRIVARKSFGASSMIIDNLQVVRWYNEQ